MRARRVFWVGIVLWALGATLPAAAHPLGNFTINHLAKISAEPSTLKVRYILDMAEIPAFQIMHESPSEPWDAARMRQWSEDEASLVSAGLHVNIDGARTQLSARGTQTTLRPGAGGLPIIRWVGTLEVALPSRAIHRIAVSDDVYSDRRIGWKDIVVGSQAEPTDELRLYPSALIGTPRRINGATFTVLPNGTLAEIRETSDVPPLPGTLNTWVAPTVLSDMFARPGQTPFLVLLTILVALGLGALHALEPGHGKALLAFTLVGSRATTRQALILAASLTFAHTAGVVLLGIVLIFANGFISESIYPWITLLSGFVIALIGARALARFVSARRASTHDQMRPSTRSRTRARSCDPRHATTKFSQCRLRSNERRHHAVSGRPVVDLRTRFGVPDMDLTSRTCMLVVQAENGGEQLTFGGVVDGVSEVLTLQGRDIDDIRDSANRAGLAGLLGTAKVKNRVRNLLDINLVLEPSELRVLESCKEIQIHVPAGNDDSHSL